MSKAKNTYGKIQNTLFSQTVALYFNMGLNDQRVMNGDFKLSSFVMSQTIISAESPDCGLSMVVPMQDMSRSISQNVINYLNSNYAGGATVGNLFNLANRMLGGDPALVQFNGGGKATYLSLTPSEIGAAVDAINNIFDECRVVVPEELQSGTGVQTVSTTVARDEGTSEDVASTLNENSVVVTAFPNPFEGKVTVEFSVPENTWATLHVFTLDGRKVATLFEGEVLAHEIRSAEFQTAAAVVYVYRLSAGSVVKMGKLLPK